MVAQPLILSDQGDISVFETVRDLERYVESPDAAEYRVYDASGRRYFFKGYRETLNSGSVFQRSQSVRLDEEHPGPQEVNELVQLLRSYLRHAGHSGPTESWSLQQLVQKATELSGYTR